jgi:hypothetical protein
MDEAEARQRCEELQATHPDRSTHQWVPVPAANGGWSVARINLPPGAAPTNSETRAEPKPQADDPRVLPPWLDPPRGGLA